MRKTGLALKKSADPTSGRKRAALKAMLKWRNRKLQEMLLEQRRRAHISQAEVGKQFGRDQSFVSRIESGSYTVSFVEVERLLRIYGTTISEFWKEVPTIHSLKIYNTR